MTSLVVAALLTIMIICLIFGIVILLIVRDVIRLNEPHPIPVVQKSKSHELHNNNKRKIGFEYESQPISKTIEDEQ